MASAATPPPQIFVPGDRPGAFRILCIDPALFMRLSDLIDILRTCGEAPVPAEFVAVVDARISRALESMAQPHGAVCPDNILVTHYCGVSLLAPPRGAGSSPAACYTVPPTDALQGTKGGDLWGLGLSLYTLATKGAVPYAGTTVTELRAAYVAGVPVFDAGLGVSAATKTLVVSRPST